MLRSVSLPLCLLNGIEVQHCLGRMLVCSVTGIDDRHVRNLRCITGGAFQMVAHNDKIDVVAYHQDGIFQCFAFGGTSRGSVGETDHTAAQPVHRSFETQTCAGGGFEEQGRCTLPSSTLRFGFASNFLALSRIRRMSSLEH